MLVMLVRQTRASNISLGLSCTTLTSNFLHVKLVGAYIHHSPGEIILWCRLYQITFPIRTKWISQEVISTLVLSIGSCAIVLKIRACSL